MRKIFAIIKYDILANKSSKYIITILFYPIVLTLVLGFVLKNVFYSNYEMEKVKVYYVSDGKEVSAQFLDVFKSLQGKIDFDMEKVQDINEANEKIGKNYDSLAISFTDKEVKVYRNNNGSVSTEIVYGVLNTIADKFNVMYSIEKINPEAIRNIDFSKIQKDFTDFKRIELKREMTSYDYYGVAEFTMIIMYISLFSLGIVNTQRRNGTEGRIFLAGVSKLQYIISRILSMTIFNMVLMTVPFIILKEIIGIYYGTDLLTLFTIFITLNLFAAALGVTFGFLFKEERVANTMIQAVVIPALTFLGGGYVYFGDNIPFVLDLITKFSPLRWANRSIINMIYGGDYSKVSTSVVINLTLTLILILISYLKIKGEEKLS
ncbi:ABC transporter permease [Clostridium sp. YIM B02551]|uniref:ABC transporter permease n=1 Tax=Clostridium sp. YIM B02551 TaxID=2910679 RepID=UPI001EEC46FF|nr:ABC transporter permease [Clostridium sp. YIM B02551]